MAEQVSVPHLIIERLRDWNYGAFLNETDKSCIAIGQTEEEARENGERELKRRAVQEQPSVWIIEYNTTGIWKRLTALEPFDRQEIGEIRLKRLKKSYPKEQYQLSEYRRVEQEPKP